MSMFQTTDKGIQQSDSSNNVKMTKIKVTSLFFRYDTGMEKSIVLESLHAVCHFEININDF